MKFPLAAAVIAAAFLWLASSSGQYRFGALVGSGIAGLTGLASIIALRFTARAARPTTGALAVVVVGFLVRLVLVALGTVAVVSGGGNIIAFVVAFFVPFFVLVALEAAYLHTLRRAPGTTA